MKPHTKIMSATFGAMFAAVAMFTHGCATPQVQSTQTPVVTSTPVPVVSTNSAGATVTNIVINVTTNFVTTLTTNFIANATVTQLAGTAQTIAPVVGAAVPQPYGGLVSLALILAGLLGTGVASSIAAAKNAQANQHASTIQAMGIGIENALPSIQQALNTTATSPSVPANAQAIAAQANAVLSAVKGSIAQTTATSGTAANLSNQLAVVGTGPHSPT